MSTVSTRLPEGRYGRSKDERADHKLKIAAVVQAVGTTLDAEAVLDANG